MSEIEERLRALEEKYVAQDKRLAEVEALARTLTAAMRSQAEIEGMGADKTEREFHVVLVRSVMQMVMAAAPVDAASSMFAAIGADLDSKVHDGLLGPIASLESAIAAQGESATIPPETHAFLKMLRTVAELAREHGITFRELNLPRP